MRRLVYLALVSVRLLVALKGNGYLHPDEHFQAPEIAASDLFFGTGQPPITPGSTSSTSTSSEPLRTWEWTAQEPARSIVPVALGSHAPFWLAGKLSRDGLPSAVVLLKAQRLALFGSSLLLDCCLYMLARFQRSKTDRAPSDSVATGPPRPPAAAAVLLFLASAGAAQAHLARFVSHSIECLVLALVLLCLERTATCSSSSAAAADERRRVAIDHGGARELVEAYEERGAGGGGGGAAKKADDDLPRRAGTIVAAGALGAVGCWTRVTFPAFALVPVGAFLRAEHCRMRLLSAVLGLAVGFGAAASLLVLLDTAYFHHHHRADLISNAFSFSPSSLPSLGRSLGSPSESLARLQAALSRWGDLVLTPLHALRYNSSVEALKTHGLHPRWLHAAVNLPLLFGPVTLVLLGPPARRNAAGTGTGGERRAQELSIMSPRVLRWTVVCAVAVLSLAPHQEPRFLLPLIVPLSLLVPSSPLLSASSSRRLGPSSGRATRLLRRAWLSLWVVHALLATAFFAFWHQGGLLPTLLELDKQLTSGELTALAHPTRNNEYSAQGSRDDEVRTTTLCFFKTFMPPRHLIVSPLAAHALAGRHEQVLIRDLPSTTTSDELSAKLQAKVCDILVAPSYLLAHELRERTETVLEGERWHVDMDRLGDMLRSDNWGISVVRARQTG